MAHEKKHPFAAGVFQHPRTGKWQVSPNAAGVFEHPRTGKWQVWSSTAGTDVSWLAAYHDEERAEQAVQAYREFRMTPAVYDPDACAAFFQQLIDSADAEPENASAADVANIIRQIHENKSGFYIFFVASLVLLLCSIVALISQDSDCRAPDCYQVASLLDILLTFATAAIADIYLNRFVSWRKCYEMSRLLFSASPPDWRAMPARVRADLEAVETDEQALAFIARYFVKGLQPRYRQIYRSDRHEMRRTPRQALDNLLCLPPK